MSDRFSQLKAHSDPSLRKHFTSKVCWTFESKNLLMSCVWVWGLQQVASWSVHHTILKEWSGVLRQVMTCFSPLKHWDHLATACQLTKSSQSMRSCLTSCAFTPFALWSSPTQVARCAWSFAWGSNHVRNVLLYVWVAHVDMPKCHVLTALSPMTMYDTLDCGNINLHS